MLSGLNFEAAGDSVVCYVSRASSRCKHDVGTLLWLNVKQSERAPTPFFGRLVRCSVHGPFFGRLRYIQLKFLFEIENLHEVFYVK